ncbi:MAG: ABC transporter permease [Burkholderiales bacterium]|jgi:ABC-2 type transport system permease protein|nr:ABC transporter permease [Burkholderiales bacterium]
MPGAGCYTLFVKELLRFWKVAFQTLAAPVLTAALYLFIFGHVLEDRLAQTHGVGYAAFLIPGLAMMSLLQNAFANSSSSLIQSKVTGNLVFVLLAPLTAGELFLAYTAASVIRGVAVALMVLLVGLGFAGLPLEHPVWALTFAVLGAALMGVFGIVAGLVAEKFDELAAFQNFVVVPLTFLAGVFYSVEDLPATWQTLSHLNPFFYLVDGFRYGFLGGSDVDPWFSLAAILAALIALSAYTLRFLASGRNLRQ